VYVIHLDDDDLLAPEAIAEAYSLLSSDPQLELVFLGVRGFGSRAEHFNSAQSEAVDRVRVLGQGQESLPWIVYFGRELGSALLQTVPIAFQRVMLTREKWKAVSTLRWRAYRVDPAIATDEDAKRALTGQLRDAEWAIYAAAICRNTALINRPLYLQRCEDQGYSSRAENEELHMRQNLMIKYRLHEAAASLPELGSWRKPIRESLASVEFAIAYRRYLLADRAASWQHLLRAIRLDPRFLYLRFALRMWLPRRQ
jgi:hypothetical protein